MEFGLVKDNSEVNRHTKFQSICTFISIFTSDGPKLKINQQK